MQQQPTNAFGLAPRAPLITRDLAHVSPALLKAHMQRDMSRFLHSARGTHAIPTAAVNTLALNNTAVSTATQQAILAAVTASASSASAQSGGGVASSPSVAGGGSLLSAVAVQTIGGGGNVLTTINNPNANFHAILNSNATLSTNANGSGGGTNGNNPVLILPLPGKATASATAAANTYTPSHDMLSNHSLLGYKLTFATAQQNELFRKIYGFLITANNGVGFDTEKPLSASPPTTSEQQQQQQDFSPSPLSPSSPLSSSPPPSQPTSALAQYKAKLAEQQHNAQPTTATTAVTSPFLRGGGGANRADVGPLPSAGRAMLRKTEEIDPFTPANGVAEGVPDGMLKLSLFGENQQQRTTPVGLVSSLPTSPRGEDGRTNHKAQGNDSGLASSFSATKPTQPQAPSPAAKRETRAMLIEAADRLLAYIIVSTPSLSSAIDNGNGFGVGPNGYPTASTTNDLTPSPTPPATGQLLQAFTASPPILRLCRCYPQLLALLKDKVQWAFYQQLLRDAAYNCNTQNAMDSRGASKVSSPTTASAAATGGGGAMHQHHYMSSGGGSSLSSRQQQQQGVSSPTGRGAASSFGAVGGGGGGSSPLALSAGPAAGTSVALLPASAWLSLWLDLHHTFAALELAGKLKKRGGGDGDNTRNNTKTIVDDETVNDDYDAEVFISPIATWTPLHKTRIAVRDVDPQTGLLCFASPSSPSAMGPLVATAAVPMLAAHIPLDGWEEEGESSNQQKNKKKQKGGLLSNPFEDDDTVNGVGGDDNANADEASAAEEAFRLKLGRMYRDIVPQMQLLAAASTLPSPLSSATVAAAMLADNSNPLASMSGKQLFLEEIIEGSKVANFSSPTSTSSAKAVAARLTEIEKVQLFLGQLFDSHSADDDDIDGNGSDCYAKQREEEMGEGKENAIENQTVPPTPQCNKKTTPAIIADYVLFTALISPLLTHRKIDLCRGVGSIRPLITITRVEKDVMWHQLSQMADALVGLKILETEEKAMLQSTDKGKKKKSFGDQGREESIDEEWERGDDDDDFEIGEKGINQALRSIDAIGLGPVVLGSESFTSNSNINGNANDNGDVPSSLNPRGSRLMSRLSTLSATAEGEQQHQQPQQQQQQRGKEGSSISSYFADTPNSLMNRLKQKATELAEKAEASRDELLARRSANKKTGGATTNTNDDADGGGGVVSSSVVVTKDGVGAADDGGEATRSGNVTPASPVAGPSSPTSKKKADSQLQHYQFHPASGKTTSQTSGMSTANTNTGTNNNSANTLNTSGNVSATVPLRFHEQFSLDAAMMVCLWGLEELINVNVLQNSTYDGKTVAKPYTSSSSSASTATATPANAATKPTAAPAAAVLASAATVGTAPTTTAKKANPFMSSSSSSSDADGSPAVRRAKTAHFDPTATATTDDAQRRGGDDADDNDNASPAASPARQGEGGRRTEQSIIPNSALASQAASPERVHVRNNNKSKEAMFATEEGEEETNKENDDEDGGIEEPIIDQHHQNDGVDDGTLAVDDAIGDDDINHDDDHDHRDRDEDEGREEDHHDDNEMQGDDHNDDDEQNAITSATPVNQDVNQQATTTDDASPDPAAETAAFAAGTDAENVDIASPTTRGGGGGSSGQQQALSIVASPPSATVSASLIAMSTAAARNANNNNYTSVDATDSNGGGSAAFAVTTIMRVSTNNNHNVNNPSSAGVATKGPNPAAHLFATNVPFLITPPLYPSLVFPAKTPASIASLYANVMMSISLLCSSRTRAHPTMDGLGYTQRVMMTMSSSSSRARARATERIGGGVSSVVSNLVVSSPSPSSSPSQASALFNAIRCLAASVTQLRSLSNTHNSNVSTVLKAEEMAFIDGGHSNAPPPPPPSSTSAALLRGTQPTTSSSAPSQQQQQQPPPVPHNPLRDVNTLLALRDLVGTAAMPSHYASLASAVRGPNAFSGSTSSGGTSSGAPRPPSVFTVVTTPRNLPATSMTLPLSFATTQTLLQWQFQAFVQHPTPITASALLHMIAREGEAVMNVLVNGATLLNSTDAFNTSMQHIVGSGSSAANANLYAKRPAGYTNSLFSGGGNGSGGGGGVGGGSGNAAAMGGGGPASASAVHSSGGGAAVGGSGGSSSILIPLGDGLIIAVCRTLHMAMVVTTNDPSPSSSASSSFYAPKTSWSLYCQLLLAAVRLVAARNAFIRNPQWAANARPGGATNSSNNRQPSSPTRSSAPASSSAVTPIPYLNGPIGGAAGMHREAQKSLGLLLLSVMRLYINTVDDDGDDNNNTKEDTTAFGDMDNKLAFAKKEGFTSVRSLMKAMERGAMGGGGGGGGDLTAISSLDALNRILLASSATSMTRKPKEFSSCGNDEEEAASLIENPLLTLDNEAIDSSVGGGNDSASLAFDNSAFILSESRDANNNGNNVDNSVTTISTNGKDSTSASAAERKALLNRYRHRTPIASCLRIVFRAVEEALRDGANPQLSATTIRVKEDEERTLLSEIDRRMPSNLDGSSNSPSPYNFNAAASPSDNEKNGNNVPEPRRKGFGEAGLPSGLMMKSSASSSSIGAECPEVLRQTIVAAARMGPMLIISNSNNDATPTGSGSPPSPPPRTTARGANANNNSNNSIDRPFVEMNLFRLVEQKDGATFVNSDIIETLEAAISFEITARENNATMMTMMPGSNNNRNSVNIAVNLDAAGKVTSTSVNNNNNGGNATTTTVLFPPNLTNVRKTHLNTVLANVPTLGPSLQRVLPASDAVVPLFDPRDEPAAYVDTLTAGKHLSNGKVRNIVTSATTHSVVTSYFAHTLRKNGSRRKRTAQQQKGEGTKKKTMMKQQHQWRRDAISEATVDKLQLVGLCGGGGEEEETFDDGSSSSEGNDEDVDNEEGQMDRIGSNNNIKNKSSSSGKKKIPKLPRHLIVPQPMLPACSLAALVASTKALGGGNTSPGARVPSHYNAALAERYYDSEVRASIEHLRHKVLAPSYGMPPVHSAWVLTLTLEALKQLWAVAHCGRRQQFVKSNNSNKAATLRHYGEFITHL